MNTRVQILLSTTSLLAYLVPLALLSGSFLPDLFISIISLIFLYLALTNREWKYFKNFFFYIFITFYIYIIINSLTSSNPFLSLESSFFYFRFGIFSLAIWFLIENNKNFIKNFYFVFLVTFLIVIFDGYYQYIYDINIFGIHSPGVRMNLLLNDKLVLGSYLSKLFPLLIALVLLNNKKMIFFFPLFTLLFISIDILVYISGERTAIIMILLSNIFIISLISKYKFLRIITLIISITIIAYISLTNQEIYNRNINHTIEQFGFSSTEQTYKSFESNEKIVDNSSNKELFFFSPQHQSHYKTALNMFKNNLLKGVGPKLFRELCKDELYNHNELSCSTHPHNIYLQLLAETGLFGFLIFLIFPIYLSSRVIGHLNSILFKKKINLNDYQVCLIACFFLTLWPIQPTNNFFDGWISIIYFLPIGFYLQSLEKNK